VKVLIRQNILKCIFPLLNPGQYNTVRHELQWLHIKSTSQHALTTMHTRTFYSQRNIYIHATKVRTFKVSEIYPTFEEFSKALNLHGDIFCNDVSLKLPIKST